MEKKQDIVGLTGLGVSVMGVIASVALNNPIFASIPLTIGIGCNFLSRKQFNDSLVEAYNTQQETINELMSKLEANHLKLNNNLIENKTNLANDIEKIQLSIKDSLNKQQKDINSEIKRLDLRYQDLKNVVDNIKELEDTTQEIRSQPNSPDFFYQRGLSFEKLGNYTGAIEDYTEAIKKNPSFAKAYHKRGVLYLDDGVKQKAVDDLRKAALLYFEQGDIDSYHQAREMSRNIHDLRTESNGKVSEIIVGTNLFE